MKKKNMIIIFVCILLIAAFVLPVSGTVDKNETLNTKNDDYDNLIEKAFKSCEDYNPKALNNIYWINNTYDTDLLDDALSIKMNGDYLYVSCKGEESVQPKTTILNATNRNNPTIVGTLNLDGRPRCGTVSNDGNFFFVSIDAPTGGEPGTGKGGFKIINCTDKANPTEEGNITFGNGLLLIEGTQYVESIETVFCADFTNAMVRSVNVSDKTNPVSISNLSTNIGSGPHAIWANETVATIVTYYGGTLQTIDVSDPSNMTVLGNYSLPRGKPADVNGDANPIIYVSSIIDGFGIYNISDPSDIVQLSYTTDGVGLICTTFPSTTDPDSLYVTDAGSGSPSYAVQRVYNQSDLTNPTKIDSITNTNVSYEIATVSSSCCDGIWIYMACQGDSVTTFRFGDKPNDPHVLSGELPNDGASGVLIGTSQLSVLIEDLEGDSFNWSIETSPDIGGSSESDGVNGSKTCDISGLGYSVTYVWFVNASDGGGWTNESYSFSTEDAPVNDPPTDPPIDPPNNPPSNLPVDDNQPPVADTSAGEPYQGFVGEEITFDGSNSSDDVNITDYFWDFGDGTNGTGNITTHVYSSPGTYKVTLTVTDNDGATDTDVTTAEILTPNQPPTTPKIERLFGSGTVNRVHDFFFNSTDPDNDTITYFIDWGDGSDIQNGSESNGTKYHTTHSWIKAGKYTITAYAKDTSNATSDTAENTTLIDAINVGNIGYLTDDTSDGVYDMFHNDTTGVDTAVELQDDRTYLIDNNGDNEWDFIFNPETGELTRYEGDKTKTIEGSPLMLILLIGTAIAIIAVIVYLYKKDYF